MNYIKGVLHVQAIACIICPTTRLRGIMFGCVSLNK